jgi:hypothetical protein
MLIINPILDMLTFQVSNIIKAMFNLERWKFLVQQFILMNMYLKLVFWKNLG